MTKLSWQVGISAFYGVGGWCNRIWPNTFVVPRNHGKAVFDFYRYECVGNLLVGLCSGPLLKEKRIMTMMNQVTEISFTVNPEAVGSFHEDGVVILHAGSGRLFSSNAIGAHIWRGLEQQLSLETIAREISCAYQVAWATAREHTLIFLAALEQQALIHSNSRH